MFQGICRILYVVAVVGTRRAGNRSGWSRLKRILCVVVIAGTTVVCPPGTVRAEDNIKDVKRSIEEKGGTVLWGRHFDHAEQLKFAAALASGSIVPYVTDLAQGVARDFGRQVSSEMLRRLLKGETIGIDGLELQAGLAVYNTWRVTYHHFLDGWPPRWKEIRNVLPLPNTAQPYIRVKQK